MIWFVAVLQLRYEELAQQHISLRASMGWGAITEAIMLLDIEQQMNAITELLEPLVGDWPLD